MTLQGEKEDNYECMPTQVAPQGTEPNSRRCRLAHGEMNETVDVERSRDLLDDRYVLYIFTAHPNVSVTQQG